MTLADAITAPHVQYRALLPMLIVLGVATAGVLVEAVLPRRAAPASPSWCCNLGGLVAAFVAVVANVDRAGVVAAGHGRPGPADAVPAGHDPAAGVPRRSCSWPSSRSTPTAARSSRQAVDAARLRRRARGSMRSGRQQTEVFPLAMFAVGGMLLFPASNNLLLMFVALEVLSLPLYLLVRAGPAPPPALAGGRDEVLPARRVLLGVLPLRHRAGLRLRRLGRPRRDRRRARSTTQSDTLLFAGIALIAVGLLFKVSAPRRSTAGRPTSTRARRRRSPRSWRACTKVAAFGALLRVFYVGFGAAAAGTGAR